MINFSEINTSTVKLESHIVLTSFLILSITITLSSLKQEIEDLIALSHLVFELFDLFVLLGDPTHSFVDGIHLRVEHSLRRLHD